MPAKIAKPSNRVAGTVAALVLSMSAGFAVLNWLHNLPAVSGAGPRALSAVGVSRGPGSWNSIRVHCIASASAQLPFHHFCIDPSGEEQFSSAWRQGRAENSGSRTIHLLLERDSRSAAVTRSQWETLIARLRTLQARYGISARDVSVDAIRGDDDGPATEDVEQLHRMLQMAGLAA